MISIKTSELIYWRETEIQETILAAEADVTSQVIIDCFDGNSNKSDVLGLTDSQKVHVSRFKKLID